MQQLSYVHGAHQVPLIGETIGSYMDSAAERFGEHDALIVAHQNVRWTYRELHQQADLLAAGLLKLGLNPGDRIGIWSQNCSEWVLTQFATAKAGLILVNINSAYRRSELEYVLEHVQCVGVPDAKYGEELCACIILRPGMQADADEIRAFCNGEIAHYKIPRYIRFVETFPMTVTGKIQKYLLRKQVAAELGLCAE